MQSEKQQPKAQSNILGNPLPRSFYARDTHVVAKALLGKLLVRSWRGTIHVGRICEVESYVGEHDKACHASRGRTLRTEIMFGEAGHAYVYLIYGMYHCLNIVTDKKDFPAAVLLRGVVPLPEFGIGNCESSILDGPGKVCRSFHITRTQNAVDLTTNTKLFITDDGFKVNPDDITQTPRIGVAYAGEDALLPWRYLISL